MNEPTYELITNTIGADIIKRTDADGKIWWIPVSEENSDYQAYLASKKEEK